ncbi:MAG: type I DNA topoisomerase, partial [Dehalococcoidia bacterium]
MTDGNGKNLVIVESPAKARTLAGILGRNYAVKASVGHVRDLPKSQLGVDIEKGFLPRYIVPREKRRVVQELQEAARRAGTIYLATDPDREGEAIAWHLVQAADLAERPYRRAVFHEITPRAIREAFRQPRDIDMQMVDAQQARRILDRLLGYKLSPLLWQKVRGGLSAGRVQSVALRLVVEREREVQGFVPREYWTIEAELARADAQAAQSFRAKLVGLAGSRKKLEVGSGEQAQALVDILSGAAYRVASVGRKEQARRPAPPFTTSTLQQEASRRYRFSPKRTMALAQQLYEGLPLGDEGEVGLITYMRTDSTHVAEAAVREARAYIGRRFGKEYVPSSPQIYRRKAKGAQEAHEAIRPTSIGREPESIRRFLTPDQYRLYSLVWQRMVASQMANARYDVTTVEVEARRRGNGEAYLFRAVNTQLRFAGYRGLYAEASDDPEDQQGTNSLPDLAAGEALRLLGLFPEQHFTEPPPRYGEATLVKAL